MKITIVVPAYNSMKYLEECINSVLAQDYSDYEVWACDNESTDGTYEYLLNLEKDHENLKVMQFPNIYKNGYPEAWKYVFENAGTDYITFVATDDYIATDYISKCMKIISYNPEKIKCLQSGIIGIQNGARINEQVHYYKSITDFKQQCMVRSPVNTPTVIYHKSLYPFLVRSALIENGLEDDGPGDYDMYCNLADNNIFIYPVNKQLGYYYRWHEEQSTWKIHNDPVLSTYHNIIKEFWKKKWTL
mgnify:CR=1 FL=1